MWFIVCWKVAGELVRPKNITCGSNNPFGVLNAAFHSSPFLIRMLLYPHRISNLVKRDCPWSCSRIVSVVAMVVHLLFAHAFGQGIVTIPFSASIWRLKVRSHG